VSHEERVLVVGSYPPVPLPSCAATLAAVRAQWEAGREVTVVSHRSGAADLAVPVIGVLGGHRLDSLRTFTAASRLVLVVEQGAPIPRSAPPVQLVCAREVARAMKGFAHSTLVVAGDPGLGAQVLGVLRSAADDVVTYPLPTCAPPGVTVRGPAEHLGIARVRSLGGKTARKVLGPRAAGARAVAARSASALAAAVKRL
jgi:hypothetical protein